MIGIVFEHCSVLWDNFHYPLGERIVQASVVQFFKFATIAFFLIGGFLINHKFGEYTPLQYLKNRFKNTIGPWLFWIMMLIILNLGNMYFLYLKFDKPVLPIFDFLSSQLENIVFYTSYWFILNFLICITILLLFKRYLYNIWFGASLGVISLFYSCNLYFEWISTVHTTALFGFVFYLWLGVYINKYFDQVSKCIKRISWPSILAINLLFFVLADVEILYLMERGSLDAFNTLRISNILYSLSMFALLLKIGPINGIQRALKPRQTTFGIYLIHQILVFRLLSEIFRPKYFNVMQMNVYEATGYTILRFLIVFSISFLLTSLLLKTKYGWLIGARKS